MFVGFRGQSDLHLCKFAWTEFAPLRRKAIRSLTTRLNVPVVRERLGQKSERSHKIDHRGVLLSFSSEKAGAERWRHPASLNRRSVQTLQWITRRWQSANYPSADIRFQTRV